MNPDLGQPLPRIWWFVSLSVFVPVLVVLVPGLSIVGDGGSNTAFGLALLGMTAIAWAGAVVIALNGVFVGTTSLTRTFGKRVLFTIPFDRIERVEVRPRYGDYEVTAWTTREDGRRIGVYASPLSFSSTRLMLDAIAGEVAKRPELLVTDGDRYNYDLAMRTGA